MYPEEKTCCFTGHRPVKLPWGTRESDSRAADTRMWIGDQLEELYGNGYRYFICGMAIGADMLFAQEVIELRKKYNDVVLFGAIPCADQASCWNRKQKLMYSELIAQCDEIKVFSNTYNNLCMNARNNYMVDHSSVLLACFNGTPGGTMNTVAYAYKQGLEVRVFDPSELVRDQSRESAAKEESC